MSGARVIPTIRLLGPMDAEAYRQLRLRGLAESPAAFSSALEDEQDRPLADWEGLITPHGDPPATFFLGAWLDGGALIGVVQFVRDLRAKARHKAMLHAMYVAPEARRSHVGSALLEEVVRRARLLQGLDQIHLWVLSAPGRSSAAAALYDAHGFRAQGPRVQDDIRVENTSLDAEYRVLRL